MILLYQKIKEILNFCLSEEPSIKTESRGYTCQQLCTKVVYRIILELAQDSFTIIEKGNSVSSAALLRSLFEYFMELIFISKSPENLLQRNLDAQKEQQKLLRAMGNSKDPILSNCKNDTRFEPRKKELEKSLCGHTQKRIWDLCNETGYLWMYDMVYRTLSQVAHPNIVNYNNRFFKNDTGVLMFEPDPKLDDEETTQRLVLLLEVLVNSTSCAHKLFPESNIPLIESKLDKFTKEVMDITNGNSNS